MKGHRFNSFLDVQLANGHTNGKPAAFASSISPLRLSSSDDSTRVQLQKQRLREEHARQRFGDSIPGFKTSAGISDFTIIFRWSRDLDMVM